MSVDAIKAAAQARIRDLVLVPELGLSNGRAEGIHWKCLNPQRADKTIGSFVVDLAGNAVGRFKDFAGPEGGDIIDLVSYCLHGPNRYQEREARGVAIRWLGRWTGVDEGGPRRVLTIDEEAARRRQQFLQRQAAEKAQLEEAAERGRRAKAWWLKHGEPIKDTPIELYIERTRGVPLADIPLTGAIKALAPTARNPSWKMFTAMAREGDLRAVHLTYLTPDGEKDLSRDPVKKIFGDLRGSVGRISKGPLRCSPEVAEKRGKSAPLALCEGLEDALTIAMLWPEWQVWFAGTVGNMSAVAEMGWPKCASELILVQDNDPEGSSAERSFEKAVDMWSLAACGRPLRVLKPSEFKDINELWKKTA